MGFIRHRQRAITAITPKGQRFINPSKGGRLRTYEELEAIAQKVFDEAGVPSSITPGPTSTPGTITQPTNTLPNASGPALIQSRADAEFWSDEGNGGGGVVGTGTQSDPYIIQSLRWFDQSNAGNTGSFIWDHAAADYYIKMIDCGFRDQTNSVQNNAQIEIDTGTAFEMVSCTNNKTGGASIAQVFLINGDLTIRQVLFNGNTGPIVTKTKPSAVLLEDCLYAIFYTLAIVG